MIRCPLAVRRVHLGFEERDVLARSGLLAGADGRLEVVAVMPDDPSYAVRLPRRLERRLVRFLERGLDAVADLAAEDVAARRAGARR